MNRLWTVVSTIALISGSITPAWAQTSTSTSGSNAGAISGSGSQSTSNPVVTSDTASTAISGSTSGSNSASISNPVNNTNTNANSTSGSNSNAATNSTASNQGNSQTINNNSTYPANQTIKAAPAVVAPALTTTLTETCMGSTSLGVSVLGFGATGGSTWQDRQCIRRLNARELAQTIGDRDAAREVMCADEEIFRVYNAMGRPCRLKPDGSANPSFVPPPASPPPPSVPQAAVVLPGPYLVFFDWNRADITSEAAVTLDKAASSYQQNGVATVQVTGHTDTSGTPAYNMELSMRRAEAVKGYLAGRGVPRDVMVLRGMGETAPLVPTGEGVRDARNRRVEIAFVGTSTGSGSAMDTNTPGGTIAPATEGNGSASASN